jgi:hypothetical protein
MGKQSDSKKEERGKGPKKKCCGKPKHKRCKRCPKRF